MRIIFKRILISSDNVGELTRAQSPHKCTKVMICDHCLIRKHNLVFSLVGCNCQVHAKSLDAEVTSSNDIIVSGVGGATIIVTNRKLMGSSPLETVKVSDVICDGSKATPIGIKCFYGKDSARNFDPNITDTTGEEFSADYVNSQIIMTYKDTDE